MTKGPKILLIRLSSIGDIVLTTPVIRALKIQLNADVHFLTKKNYASLLKNNPYISKIHSFEDGYEQLIKENFDHLVDLHHNLRTLKIKRTLKVKSSSFSKLNFKKFLLTVFKINQMPKVHIVDRYFDAVSTIGVTNDEKGLDFFLPSNLELPLEYKLEEPYVALVIGGQHTTKKLPNSKLVELCQQIKKPVVLLGDKEDVINAVDIKVQVPRVINACGKLSLNQSALLVKGADYVITNDTGLMHIAAAFKKKIFSVWGNTVPEFGMYPYKPHDESKIIQHKSLWCRPCSKIGYRSCPLGHFKCMNDLKINDILGK